MDGATLYIKQLKPYLYLLDEEHQATGYLVIGENKAVLIDTMNGLTNLRAEVEKLTKGQLVEVKYSVESREYKERWYTSLRYQGVM